MVFEERNTQAIVSFNPLFKLRKKILSLTHYSNN